MSDKRKARPGDTVVFGDETVRDLEKLTFSAVLKDATLSLNVSGINTEPGKSRDFTDSANPGERDTTLSADIERAFAADAPEEDATEHQSDDTLGIDLEEG